VAAPGEGEGGAQPPTEQIHLPGPSYLPATVALGTTLALVGVVLSWALFALGMVILVVPLIIWIRQAREGMSELPLER
jgi:hypothetical protein